MASVLEDRFGLVECWEMFVEARAIHLTQAADERDVAAVLRALEAVEGGTIIWEYSEAYQHLEPMCIELKNYAQSQAQRNEKSAFGGALDAVRKTTVRLRPHLRPAEPTFLHWGDRTLRALTVGKVRNQLLKIRSYTAGEGKKIAAFVEERERKALEDERKALEQTLRVVRPLRSELKNVEDIAPARINWIKEPLSSEQSITSKSEPVKKFNQVASVATDTRNLPTNPPRYWPHRPRGRPTLGEEEVLISFLNEVYGQYLPEFKDELREYIHKKDKKLYRAIQEYESNNDLPKHLEMPTRDQKYFARLIEAEAVNFTGMTRRQREHAQARLEAFRAGQAPRVKLNRH